MSRRLTIVLIILSLLIASISMLLRPLLTSITTTLFKPTTTAISKMTTVSPASPKWKGVIVVGSGLAGLTTASELIASNIPVHMLERYPKPGGNSIKASSGINGAPTRFQAGPEIDKYFYADTVASVGKVMLVPEWTDLRESLVQALTGDSKSAVEWLVDEKGVDLSVVAMMGGHSVARTHRGAGKTPPGASLVLTLLKSLKESPLFELESECVVTKVLRKDEGKGRVEGVEYECTADGATTTKTLYGPVVFATGGFAGDSGKAGMLAKYRPDLASYPSTNSHRPGSQGLLTAVGARLIDMEYVQVHPTAFVDPKDEWEPVKFLAAEMLRGEGGVLLHGGKRFINELKTRKVVVDAITALPSTKMAADENGHEKQQWGITLLLDEATYQKTKAHVDFYIFKGLMHKTTIWALPNSESVLATLAEYSTAATGKAKDVLGRTDFGAWKLGSSGSGSDVDLKVEMGSTVYVGTVTPAIHFTMGGVVIDEFANVMEAGPDGNGGSEKGSPIEGLWAAGEVTGGVHGENRLGGSSLLECVVFGRRAARGAGEYFNNL